MNVHGLGKVTAGSLTVGTIVAGAVIGAYIVPSVVGVFVQNKFLGFENRLSNAQLAGRSAALGALMGVPLAAMLGIGVAVSMFSALTVSKTLLLMLNTTPLGRRKGMFTPEPLPKTNPQASDSGDN